MAALTASMQAVRPSSQRVRGTALRAAQNGSRTVMAAERPIWLPGGDFPKRECRPDRSRLVPPTAAGRPIRGPALGAALAAPAALFSYSALFPCTPQIWSPPSSPATLASVGAAAHVPRPSAAHPALAAAQCCMRCVHPISAKQERARCCVRIQLNTRSCAPSPPGAHPAAPPTLLLPADPLGLGANDERLRWFSEAERVHSRWAMLGVAGILAQEVVHPDVFWYTSGATLDLPFNITGLVALELFAMHWVETKRGYDVLKPGSQDQDPVFSNYKLPAHEVGYPGGVFAPFIPGDLEELKLKEIKNGRLAMLAFIGEQALPPPPPPTHPPPPTTHTSPRLPWRRPHPRLAPAAQASPWRRR
jgi:hypothetical protein